MKRKAILWLLLDLIFVAVFNIVFFVLGGGERPASVWISYGFIHFAYAMTIATPLLTRNCRETVLKVSVYAVSSGYFLLEFIVGLVFILISPSSFKPALVVQLIIAAIYLALLIIFLLANENTNESLEREERENAFIKTSASKVKLLMGKVGEKDCEKALERLYDLIHASPSRSSASVKDTEQQCAELISQLEAAVNGKEKENTVEIAGRLEELFKERNQTLKMGN